MQKAYIVTRDGKEVIAAIEDLTDDELESIATALEKEGDGHMRHAAEIESFVNLRQQIDELDNPKEN